ncbi:MAG: Exopolyphosphatase [uncultured Rubrobacteraceae bacterium]|uniref:Exopolyphosphatase n=1 Tax=uncultured Rubrobacteraceae bacterium TaxID=349277 RepID=A0A6J4NGU2_9ACTN|nr:MAG: Exopolyphosphatase [uncultured Rubrobacteraceae bacterium]
MSRYSVVDVGSNTIHLLVGEVEDGGVLPVTGEKFSARLGAGVERTGRLEDERLLLAAEAINFFARIAALNGAPSPEVLATSAVRDAANGAELVERVGDMTGLKMRLISGKKEAELGFRGALSALKERPEKVVVVDLGGGSAQLILGDRSGEIEERVSLPLGTNRTTERFVRTDPPTDEELEALRDHAFGMLPGWDVGEAPVVAVGGSARAMLKITSDALTVERLRKLSGEIRQRPFGLLAREHGLTPERARVLPAAITTLTAVLEIYGKERLNVARGGIREGTLLALAERGEI